MGWKVGVGRDKNGERQTIRREERKNESGIGRVFYIARKKKKKRLRICSKTFGGGYVCAKKFPPRTTATFLLSEFVNSYVDSYLTDANYLPEIIGSPKLRHRHSTSKKCCNCRYLEESFRSCRFLVYSVHAHVFLALARPSSWSWQVLAH